MASDNRELQVWLLPSDILRRARNDDMNDNHVKLYAVVGLPQFVKPSI